MILAFDTYYFGGKAKTVCLQFAEWTDSDPMVIFSETIPDASEYIPGEFYKRELPCIMSLLKQIDLSSVDIIIVDGFVVLDDEGKFGLGGYLYQELECKIPVIGVAKNDFLKLIDNKVAVYRGESIKALYITSIGIDKIAAAKYIMSMHGIYRMPTILKLLDTLTKEIN